MSHDKTSGIGGNWWNWWKPSVTGVNQSSAKLNETDVTSNDVMKQSITTVNNPQGMENTNATGLFAYIIMQLMYKKFIREMISFV